MASAAKKEKGDEPRLPDYFPLIDKKKTCKTIALQLFSCIDEHGNQPEGVRDPKAGNKIFQHCGKQLDSYKSCMHKAKADTNPRLVRAPQAYLDQLAELK